MSANVSALVRFAFQLDLAHPRHCLDSSTISSKGPIFRILLPTDHVLCTLFSYQNEHSRVKSFVSGLLNMFSAL